MRGQRMAMVAACCVAMAASAAAQATLSEDPLFAGVKQFERNAVSTVEVNHGPVTLERAEGTDGARRHGASSVNVFKYDQDGAYDAAAVKVYEERAAAQGWSCETIPSKRHPGAYRYKCRKPLADGYHDAVDILVEAKQLVFVHSISDHEEHDDDDSW